ncbi:hypothetical protein ALC62_00207 [Cyphomyrmex costatus]|uniref:Uncharacterized protein n=1 Tax=Cyphomyrmex costatus TaxID=456900 RepID=A0A195D798_9HYME|nr:hypothetical protein ALC62_00207 [Cyphomyrmex costatus]
MSGARYEVSATRRRQFHSGDQLNDDDEVSARLRCGMIVCHRHPTRATGNHADGIELSASAIEANAKLEIYPFWQRLARGWHSSDAIYRTANAGERAAAPESNRLLNEVERLSGWLAGWSIRLR